MSCNNIFGIFQICMWLVTKHAHDQHIINQLLTLSKRNVISPFYLFLLHAPAKLIAFRGFREIITRSRGMCEWTDPFFLSLFLLSQWECVNCREVSANKTLADGMRRRGRRRRGGQIKMIKYLRIDLRGPCSITYPGQASSCGHSAVNHIGRVKM